MGFSYALAQLLSSPPYMFAIIVSLTLAHVSDKIKLRWPIMIAQSLTACVGLLICLYGGPPGVRYFGLFLATFGTQANIPGTLAYGQNQTAQVHKRGVVAAAMISVGAAGGICGSTIFMEKHAPVCKVSLQSLYLANSMLAVSPWHVGHNCHATALFHYHLLHVNVFQEDEQTRR